MLHKTMMFRTLEKRAKNINIGQQKQRDALWCTVFWFFRLNSASVSMHSSAMCGLDTKVNKASKAPTLWSSLVITSKLPVFNSFQPASVNVNLPSFDNTWQHHHSINNDKQKTAVLVLSSEQTNHHRSQTNTRVSFVFGDLCVYFCVLVRICLMFLFLDIGRFCTTLHSTLPLILTCVISCCEGQALFGKSSNILTKSEMHGACLDEHNGKGTKSSWLYHIQITST